MAYVSRALRQLVTARASGLCEYCHTAQASVIEIEIDHIVPEVAGGVTEAGNLCPACIAWERGRLALGARSRGTVSRDGFRTPSMLWSRKLVQSSIYRIY